MEKTLDRTTRDKIKRLQTLAMRATEGPDADWDSVVATCQAALDGDWPAARQALAWHRALKNGDWIAVPGGTAEIWHSGGVRL